MKTCTKCHQSLSLESYHCHAKSEDGRQSRCKECAKVMLKEYYQRNKERIKQRVKVYSGENKGKVSESQKKSYQRNKEKRQAYYAREDVRERNRDRMRQRYKKQREHILSLNKKYRQKPEFKERMRVYQAEWAQTEKGKASVSASQGRYREDNPIKIKARAAVATAVENGSMQRPIYCECCKAEGPVEGHHHRGYEPQHWLDVKWLCRGCHVAAEKLIMMSN
jgi:hypothetical protein